MSLPPPTVLPNPNSMTQILQLNQLHLQQLQRQQEQQERTRLLRIDPERSASLGGHAAATSRGPLVVHDPRDPLYVSLPLGANPTEVLALRFGAWRSIIKLLVVYLKETANVHEEMMRQQLRLQQALQFPFVAPGSAPPRPAAGGHHSNLEAEQRRAEQVAATKLFLPQGNGLVQDIPGVLAQFHASMATNTKATARELTTKVIPRLEELRKDLLVKIKEIRSLLLDFRLLLSTDLSSTRDTLKRYQQAIDTCRRTPALLHADMDPYLIKTLLDRLLKLQVTEELYLHDAFVNLQLSGKELEKIVVVEVQNALTTYAQLLGTEAQVVFDRFIVRLDSGILTKELLFEWDAFVAKDENFIDPNLPTRLVQQLHYAHMSNPLGYEVRSGYLERRTKFTKLYARSWFVLTPSFLHEFRLPDRKQDPKPVKLFPLQDCLVLDLLQLQDGKFVLKVKEPGLIRKDHNYLFRADLYSLMKEWFDDLKQLTNAPNPVERLKLAQLRHGEAVAARASRGDVALVSTAPRQSFAGVPQVAISSHLSVSDMTTTPLEQAPNGGKLPRLLDTSSVANLSNDAVIAIHRENLRDVPDPSTPAVSDEKLRIHKETQFGGEEPFDTSAATVRPGVYEQA